MNFVEQDQLIAIIYRIYYKVITTQFNVRVICQSIKDKTLLLQYNLHNTPAFLFLKISNGMKLFMEVNGN